MIANKDVANLILIKNYLTQTISGTYNLTAVKRNDLGKLAKIVDDKIIAMLLSKEFIEKMQKPVVESFRKKTLAPPSIQEEESID